ncbi:hypothetical protein [Paenibacillus sp. FSL R10-2771]|uniref:hypothetical protein n=1 Tax=Paenibacillus sp. FSL R10-2771 TaxID=2954693 RepID=UPI0030FC3DD2
MAQYDVEELKKWSKELTEKIEAAEKKSDLLNEEMNKLNTRYQILSTVSARLAGKTDEFEAFQKAHLEPAKSALDQKKSELDEVDSANWKDSYYLDKILSEINKHI